MSRELTRLWAYDRCLKNRSINYTWQDLMRIANEDLEDQGYEKIKKTQFFNDIKTLKRPPYLAPIVTEKQGRKSYYRYSDPDYSIKNQELNELEAEQLKSALMVLSRFKGLPQFDWVQEVIPKIEQNFGLSEASEDLIGFGENVDLVGLEYIGVLFNHILYKKHLKITYQSFKSSEPKSFELSPYYLKQYNNRWFLLGQSKEFDSLTTLALDRMQGIEETGDEFLENTQYDFSEYFEDMIGVSKPEGQKPEMVRLWFSPNQADYVLTKPLHGTQKVKAKNEEGLEITIEVIVNFELEQLILRHGERCRVIEPESFRVIVASRLNNAIKQY